MPLRGKYKIFIIDEVHMISSSGFNALLKTLEEPLHHVKFIFATTEFRKIPETINSRCQRIHLRKIFQKKLALYCKLIVEKEGALIEAGAAEIIADVANGSVRDGLSVLEHLLLQYLTMSVLKKNNEIFLEPPVITEKDVYSMLGKVPLKIIEDILLNLSQSNLRGALEVMDEMRIQGTYETKAVVIDFTAVVYGYLLKQMGSKLTTQTNSDCDVLQNVDNTPELHNKFSNVFLLRAWDLLVDLERQIRNHHNPIHLIEIALRRLSYISAFELPDQLINTLESIVKDEFYDKCEILDSNQFVSSSTTQSDNGREELNFISGLYLSLIQKIEKLIDLASEAGKLEFQLTVMKELRIMDIDYGNNIFVLCGNLDDKKKRELQTAMQKITNQDWQIDFAQDEVGKTFLEMREIENMSFIKKIKDSPLHFINIVSFRSIFRVMYLPK